MSDSFSKHEAAISAGQVSASNVIGLRKAINAAERRNAGWSTSSTCPRVDGSRLNAALELIAEKRPRVTGHLHDSGVARLQDRRYRSRWDERQAAIIAALDHFELIGFDVDHSGRATPIYRAVSATGDSFRFINRAWQSGGNGPEIF